MTAQRTSWALPGPVQTLAPGVLLCAAISLAAVGVQRAEERFFGHGYVEALVLAILAGAALRSSWTPGVAFRKGIAFSGKTLLEIAVMLLGASISTAALAAAGAPLLLGILLVVAASLVISYGLSRALGLSATMGLLIASGNAICGNSAIAAVASVIEADAEDIASSIAFTAILGVIVVLTLPVAAGLLRLDEMRYGALAGLTVYAVPQVLAATVPVGPIATQLGTVVKLVRVMILGPLVFGVALARRATRGAPGPAVRFSIWRFVPWFVVGFVGLALLRAAGVIPERALAPIQTTTAILTIMSMAALGLGVDIRQLRHVGARVTAAVTLSIMALATMSYVLISLLAP
nr:putative sulfate exporter family transporter [Alsobacter soli]